MADRATDYRDLLRRCREDGSTTHVVIAGGLAGLGQLSLAQLRPAALRFHDVNDCQHTEDCIRGDLFRHIYRSKESAVTPPNPHGPQGRYYFDSVTFHEMVRICQSQGDGVIVGVDDGGARALRKLSPAAIVVREYKYDFADKPLGSKDLTNWMSGSEFLQVCVQAGLL